MNLGLADAVRLASDVARETADDADAVAVAVCPPAVWLEAVAERLRGSAVALGAQNVHPEASGAFTGEVAPAMLAEVGARYVIVGHSERRALFGESSAFVAEKVRAVQAAGMVPVLCVGETLEERDGGDAEAVVLGQLAASLDGVALDDPAALVVAYEPVWAIGTGRTATPEQAQAMHAAIRAALAARFGGGEGGRGPVRRQRQARQRGRAVRPARPGRRARRRRQPGGRLVRRHRRGGPCVSVGSGRPPRWRSPR